MFKKEENLIKALDSLHDDILLDFLTNLDHGVNMLSKEVLNMPVDLFLTSKRTEKSHHLISSQLIPAAPPIKSVDFSI